MATKEIVCEFELVDSRNLKQGWKLQGISTLPKDKRDGQSIFASICKTAPKQSWVIRASPNGYFNIINQSYQNYILSGLMEYKTDQIDKTQSRLCLHREQREAQEWKII